jgi:hypothetical protein
MTPVLNTQRACDKNTASDQARLTGEGRQDGEACQSVVMLEATCEAAPRGDKEVVQAAVSEGAS